MVVPLGQLDDSVEDEHPAEEAVLEDENFLEPGPALVQHGVDGEHLRVVGVEPLLKRVHSITPRLCSEIVSMRGRNAPRSTSMALWGSAAPHMKASTAA
jgi:hypothetical protein